LQHGSSTKCRWWLLCVSGEGSWGGGVFI